MDLNFTLRVVSNRQLFWLGDRPRKPQTSYLVRIIERQNSKLNWVGLCISERACPGALSAFFNNGMKRFYRALMHTKPKNKVSRRFACLLLPI